MGKTNFILAAVVLCFAVSTSCLSLENSENNVRIKQGTLLTIENVPWQVSVLNSKEEHVCGGAIVSEFYILTTAQCLTDRHCAKVRTGSSKANKGGKITSIRRRIVHEDYDDRTYDYDIGLIELRDRLKFTPNTAAISLSMKLNDLEVGTEVQIAGWGTGKAEQEHLQEIRIPTILREDCKEIYAPRGGLISVRQNCAGDPVTRQSACEGDEGGAVVLDDQLIGVFSWGMGCINPKYPSVYTDINTLRSWVEENTYKSYDF